MKKIYSRSIIHRWFQLMWMICLALPLKARRSTPPVIQGQQVIEGGLPVGSAFALVAPDYNCTSGALTFKTTGGDGSSIEYQAAGITGWTTNPNQFVDRDSRTANDVKPFTLMARQNGSVVTYVWDLKAACGRARVGLEEPNAGLQVRVLGNPVVGQTAEVEVSGVSGERVQLNLVDGQGRNFYQHTIGQAGVLEQVSVPLGQRSGLLLLQVQTGKERQTVKLLKE